MAKNNEFNAARERLAMLETKPEALHRSHGSAVDARSKQLLDGDINDKALTAADDRCAAIENSLRGLEDALTIQRDKVAQLDAALKAQRDQEQRETKAVAIEARVPKLEGGIAAVEPALKKLIADFHGCEKPEAKAAGLLLEDAWQQVVRETSKITAELQADARHLRITPTPPPVKPSARPTPQLLPQNFRKADLPDAKFVDWTSR